MNATAEPEQRLARAPAISQKRTLSPAVSRILIVDDDAGLARLIERTLRKRHVVNPLHITAIDETDAGCVVHFRWLDTQPIVLTDTVEVMAGALESCQIDPVLSTVT